MGGGAALRLPAVAATPDNLSHRGYHPPANGHVSVRQTRPGQLQGAATALTPIGEIAKNKPCGVFGTLTQTAVPATLPVAPQGEIVTGAAKIRSTVCGTTPRDYDVTILKIYPEGAQDGRNLLLRVTDPALLTATGGIVQGMSGSPILQNGKLIGAVTHVLVDDPTTGYGIFLENMLNAAG